MAEIMANDQTITLDESKQNANNLQEPEPDETSEKKNKGRGINFDNSKDHPRPTTHNPRPLWWGCWYTER